MKPISTLTVCCLTLFLISGCASIQSRINATNQIEEDEIVQIPVDPDSNELPIELELKGEAPETEAVEGASEELAEDESEADAVEAIADIPPQMSPVKETSAPLKVYPEIPHHYNRHVQKWLDYFQGRGKPHMKRYLERSARYLPAMQKILKENGMPEDLVYIALIESGFGSSARSHAGAVGYWQFIAPTGRRYNLTINSLIDERKDPYKSTIAAVKYFRSLYNVFGNWYFAFASYNGGENRMFRVLMKHESRDFWAIAETKRTLPRETVNYIPKYLAARMIAKNPERYGFKNLEYQAPLSYAEVIANQTVNLKNLAKELGVDYEEIRLLNAQYNTEFAPNFKKEPLVIRVPNNMVTQAKVALEKSYVTNDRVLASVKSSETYRYKVRRGDTLGKIARKHGTTISRIRSLNRINRKGLIRVGQYLRVPEGPAAQRRIMRELRKSLDDSRTAEKQPKNSSRSAPKTITVKRGDTMIGIANRYGVRYSDLLSANRMTTRSKLLAGKRLKIPASSTTASAAKPRKKVITVRRGDTLTQIARRYNTSLSKILAENDMTRKSKLLAGTKLVVPLN